MAKAIEHRGGGPGPNQDHLKELITVRGRSVDPAQLERVLRQHPSVRDAAVLGRPHPDYGEVPVAYVALQVPVGCVALIGPPTAEDLNYFVGWRVPAYKRLHEVHIVDELPGTPSAER